MDFRFTEEQEKLKKEFHEFCINEVPEDHESGVFRMSEEGQDFWRKLQKKAGEKGYLVPGWPKEWGGMGLGAIEQGIIYEETGYQMLTWPGSSGLRIGGPAVALVGTEEQKRKFLPALAHGEANWTQAFTEPQAGSDEANVQLRAVEDGDYFVLNGQKTFIGQSLKPDYLYTLVRTKDTVPKQRGVSLLLVPTDLPGITFRALPTMGGTPTNDIFFDDVRVPKENLLGEVNRGFYHAMEAVAFERAGTGRAASAMRDFDEFVEFCRETKRNGKPLIKDPEVRKKLAQMAVENRIYWLTGWWAQWWFGQRQKLGPKPYDFTGIYWKMIPGIHSEWMMHILGLYGQLRTGSKWAKLAGRVERLWQAYRSWHLGGTVEILKYVIAARGLGLPRIPRQFHAMIAKAVEERGG